MSDCSKLSPVKHLERCGYLSDQLIAAHANHLDEGDTDVLARNRVHVVHCPRSHAYFGHAPFPHDALAKAGVNICLGTDSLASVKADRKRPRAPLELDIFSEMRAFAVAHPDVTPHHILRMVTLNPARALRRETKLGQLSPNALADLIALEYSGPIEDSAIALLETKPKLRATVINGVLH